MGAVRRALKRVAPLEALYVSFRATPTLRDAFAYSLYRTLVWLVDRFRFARGLSVAVGRVSRRLHVTFALTSEGGPPATLTLPVQPQAYWTLVEVFSHACYRPLVPLAPDVIVDAGANIGLATVYLHGLFPGARFVCVEPDPANIPLLRRNLTQNGVRADVVEVVLGQVEGQADFRVHQAASEYSTAGPTVFPDGEFRTVRVAARPLAPVLAEAGVERVGMLKIDIEGGEFGVLGGAASLPPLDYLAGEFHGFAGDIGRLAEVTTAATGLVLLRRTGGDELATLHFGRRPA